MVTSPFLSQYIQSLSKGDQVHIADVLSTAISNVEQLTSVINSLSTLGSFTPLVLTNIPQGNLIFVNDLTYNIQNATSAINNIFGTSNNISLLLANINKQLLSQVHAAEGQLRSLEKRAHNVSFLLADNGAFASSYSEDFSNNNGRAHFSWLIPDRNSTPFSSSEQAIVNSVDNSLVLAQNLVKTIPLVPRIAELNANAYLVSDTGIQNCVTSLASTGWRAEFALPHPVTASLNGATDSGVQAWVEFQLAQPSFISELEIIPFVDSPMQLEQIRLYYSSGSNTYNDILTAPVTLNGPYVQHISLQTVSKFSLLLNQSTYVRQATQINTAQNQYSSFTSQKKIAPLSLGGKSSPRKYSYQRFFKHFFNATRNFPEANISRPQTFKTTRGVSIDETLRSVSTEFGPYVSWNQGSGAENMITNLFLQQPGYKKIFNKIPASSSYLQNNAIIAGPVDPAPATAVVSPPPTPLQGSFSYQYDLGLQYVGVGSNSIGDRGVFVSTSLPSVGHIGAVRIAAVDQNVILSNTNRQSTIATSIEYSVSDVSNPQLESNWIPIVPTSTNPTLIYAERFFPNRSGQGYFRFTADRTQAVTLYKNGYTLGIDTSNYILDPSKNLLLGLAISPSLFGAQDILTVDYSTDTDYSTVTFSNLSNFPIYAVTDSNGAGEGFVGTGAGNLITLAKIPYINYTKVASSTYDPLLGLNPYQPITITMQDGTNAINLTNYLQGAQTKLTSFTDGYYFIQSGTNIRFNVPITTPFRVYYNYLQSTVRTRIVLRVNDTTFASPQVSSLNVKSKVIKPDAGALK